MHINESQNKRGFTLIELLISVSVFVVVITIAIGAMINIAHVNDRSQAVLVAMENLDFALENMSRQIRLGSDYCNGNCGSNPLDSFTFIDSDGLDRTYEYAPIADPASSLINLTVDGGTPHSITAPEIDIENLSFYVFGENPSDGLQPRVVILVGGITNIPGLKPEEQAEFDIQTTVTQRNSDFPGN